MGAHTVDLDELIGDLRPRLQEWTDAGLVVGQITWSSESQPGLTLDRGSVQEPWAFGFQCFRFVDAWDLFAWARVVVFHYGYADFDWFAGGSDYTSEAPMVEDSMMFRKLLDRVQEKLLPIEGKTSAEH
ncbi:MAG: hypothetical protein H6682_18710 [Candidatus Eisenbacteria bacterium]|nr:hypothetical protein [Candidatus Eisenbacteria bacterium]